MQTTETVKMYQVQLKSLGKPWSTYGQPMPRKNAIATVLGALSCNTADAGQIYEVGTADTELVGGRHGVFV